MKTILFAVTVAVIAVNCSAQSSGSFSKNRPTEKKILHLTPVSEPITLDDLIRMSSVIAYGVVTSVPSAEQIRQASGRHTVETRAHITLSGTLKGGAADHSAVIVLAQMGGNTGDLELSGPDDHLVVEGERYLLFLMNDGTQETRANNTGLKRLLPVGIWSGKVKIVDGKISFLPKASAQLHQFDNMDINVFTQLVKDKINNVIVPNTCLPIHPGGKRQ